MLTRYPAKDICRERVFIFRVKDLFREPDAALFNEHCSRAIVHEPSPSPAAWHLAKSGKIESVNGGDTVSTEAVAARRHAGTHLPVTWWKLEMPITIWHLLLN